MATFGRLRVTTPLANIDEAHVTEDYRWWTSVGARLSMVDDGLTFESGRCRPTVREAEMAKGLEQFASGPRPEAPRPR